MLKFIVMTCRFHISDMFNEMSFMAIRGSVKSLLNCLN